MLPYYIPNWLAVINTGAILLVVWRAATLATLVQQIKDNHLPHIEAGLQRLEDAFIKHLDKPREL